MATVRELTDPHLWSYVPVPQLGAEGSCDVCHSAPNPGYSTCYSCSTTTVQVSHPCKLVVPVSLSEPFGQLHHVMKHYKNEALDAATRNGFVNQIAALIARFLHIHRSCITTAGGPWDTVTSVPSTSGRAGEHPLETAIKRAPGIGSEFEPLLVPGPVPLAHTQADDKGFTAVPEATGRSVLLVDDTFTSGARSQSAASALHLAGATVVAIVPVARIVNPEWSGSVADLWNRSRARSYDFSYCCVGAHPLPPAKAKS